MRDLQFHYACPGSDGSISNPDKCGNHQNHRDQDQGNGCQDNQQDGGQNTEYDFGWPPKTGRGRNSEGYQLVSLPSHLSGRFSGTKDVFFFGRGITSPGNIHIDFNIVVHINQVATIRHRMSW